MQIKGVNRAVNKYIKWAKETPKKASNSAAKPDGDDFTNYSKLQKAFPPALMWGISIMQCFFLMKSKDMPEDKKYPLIFNNIYSGIIGSIGGMLAEKHVENFTDKLVKRANELGKADLTNGIKTAVPVASTIFLFQYVGPVISTPLASKTTQYLVKKDILDLSSKKNK